MGLFQTGNIPVIFADNPPVLKLNVTARCLFAGVVATAENQKNLPNPYREEINYAFVMNDDCSGVNQGAESVLSGAADIGTLYRPLTHGEKAAGLVETKLDNLAYAVTVHRKNPVNDLTTRQVAEIFAGQIQNWKAVGGEDKDILIYRQKCGANYDYLIDQTIAAAGIEKNHARLKKAVMDVEITDNQFEKIAALDMAITMAPRFFFDVNCKPLRINGLLPTRNSEKNGEYPFLARISLVSRRDASRAVQTYLSFMSGPRGRKLIENGLNMDWLRHGF
ncbi:PBM domain-containing protein [Desulfonema magnum]|uniref:PBM domain-containing protein n=2 Tax=Desulfonema magnum TaxID=45655 RepID=A0A975BKW6_9BACT|nr:PBM domain-containing protein [Desulfonema magnum]